MKSSEPKEGAPPDGVGIKGLKELAVFAPHCRAILLPLLGMVAATALQSAALLMLPMVYRIIFDDLLVHMDRQAFVRVAGYVAFFLAVMGVATLAVDTLVVRIKVRLAGLIRRNLFKRLLAYRMSFFLEHDLGRLVQSLVGDSDMTAQALTQLFQLLAYLLQIALLFIVLGAIDRDVALLLGVALLFYFAWGLVWKRPMERSSARIGEAYGRLYGCFYEGIPGIKEVKLNGLHGYLLERLGRVMAALRRHLVHNALYNTLLALASMAVPWITLCALLVLCAGKIQAGTMSVGMLATLFVLMWGMFSPVDKITSVLNVLTHALPAAGRINALCGDFEESPGTVDLPGKPEAIRFDRVTFSYDGQRTVLDQLDTQWPAGAHIAIVGPSGSGKSTIVSLLAKLWEEYEGHIWLDGHEARTLRPENLRRAMSVIVQDSHLFQDSIRNNIDFTGAMSDQDLWAVCREVQLSEFIQSLPEGLDTPIGERGARLSGGERQRVVLARALARNPAVLVLDEALSALDPENDRKIRDMIERCRRARGMTVVHITHRLETVRQADLILVMENGRLVESGRHDDLVRRQGTYVRLLRETEQALAGASDAPAIAEAASSGGA